MVKLRRVLLATKKTILEYFKEGSDDFDRRVPADELARIRDGHEEHYASLALVRKTLAVRGIAFTTSYMPYAAFEDFLGHDLIISVGGDGTLLNASHYILDSTPVLALRSDKHSTGALCAADAADFEAVFDRMLRDDLASEQWTRAAAAFDGRRVLALNEVYIGDLYSMGMARYELTLDGNSEWQASSGLFISTGTGSTGWFRNKTRESPFPRTARELRFTVREDWMDGRYRLLGGTLKPGQVLRVRSMMNVDGCISLDGDKHKRAYPFARGAIVEVGIADESLCMVRMEASA